MPSMFSLLRTSLVLMVVMTAIASALSIDKRELHPNDEDLCRPCESFESCFSGSPKSVVSMIQASKSTFGSSFTTTGANQKLTVDFNRPDSFRGPHTSMAVKNSLNNAAFIEIYYVNALAYEYGQKAEKFLTAFYKIEAGAKCSVNTPYRLDAEKVYDVRYDYPSLD